MKKWLIICLFTISLSLGRNASAVVITFDEFDATNDNTAITSLYAAQGVTFGSDNSGIWDGLSGGDPGLWHLDGSNGPQFLGNNGVNNGDSFVTSIFFSSPATEFDIDASKGPSIIPAAGFYLTVEYFLGSDWKASGGSALGDVNWWGSFGYSGSGIDKVIFSSISTSGYPNYGLDNLRFTLASVPEPSTFLLLGFGLAGVGLFRRKFTK